MLKLKNTKKNINLEFTESFVNISCGGTSNVTVRRSTVTIVSMHGKIKNNPGPLAPPGKILPKRSITALSYSLTILNINRSVMIFFLLSLVLKI